MYFFMLVTTLMGSRTFNLYKITLTKVLVYFYFMVYNICTEVVS